MEKHNLDKLFSEKLEEVQVEPQAASWDQIEENLNTKGRKANWSWIGIAASALLAVLSSWYLLSSGTTTDSPTYDYANSDINASTLPTQIVYVPIYIHTVAEPQEVKPIKVAPEFEETKNQYAVVDTKPTVDKSVYVTDTKEIITEQPEVITLEEVPVVTEDEVIIASQEDVFLESEPETLQNPVTIIYKQGEPAEESNFTKAMSYMEEVRMGEKKLVNFEKLRENFRSKFKSSEEVDTE